MLRGDAPVETLDLTPNMALSSMKINTSTGSGGPARIFYRHIAELEPGAAMAIAGGSTSTGADEEDGAKRVFKFGCDLQPDFERWSRSIRAAIDAAGAKAKTAAATAMALESATNASDLFRSAIASPKDRPKRRTSILSSASADKDAGGPVNVSPPAPDHSPSRCGGDFDCLPSQMNVRLLDNTLLHVTVAKGGTVKDVLVNLRRQLGVRADADYSLYLRQLSAEGRDIFACLPDVMSAEEADALACAW